MNQSLSEIYVIKYLKEEFEHFNNYLELRKSAAWLAYSMSLYYKKRNLELPNIINGAVLDN